MLAALLAGALCAFGQATTDYNELPNPTATDAKAWSAVKKVTAGWGDTDTRYNKELPAKTTAGSISLTAWRGVLLQFVRHDISHEGRPYVRLAYC